MSSDFIFDVTPGAFNDVTMTSHTKDPDIMLLCEELENIVDDFMSMYRVGKGNFQVSSLVPNHLSFFLSFFLEKTN